MNKNMLSPVGFNFYIKKLPELNFFVQSVNIPGVQLGYTEQPNPFKKIPVYGDHWEYTGELTVGFKINEDLGNYISIYEWLQSIAFPDSFEQFKKISAVDKKLVGEGIESDAHINILSSAMNPIIRIDFEDVFPIALSDIPLDVKDSSIEYIEATASFKFTKYTWNYV
jgi:hypothetical protein